jgi:hypothetical protein
LLKLKPPPTNRIWWGFYAPGPKLSLTISPTVSDTSLNFSVIQQAIDRKINDVIKETIVLPNMDDLVLPGMDDLDVAFHTWMTPSTSVQDEQRVKSAKGAGLGSLLGGGNSPKSKTTRRTRAALVPDRIHRKAFSLYAPADESKVDVKLDNPAVKMVKKESRLSKWKSNRASKVILPDPIVAEIEPSSMQRSVSEEDARLSKSKLGVSKKNQRLEVLQNEQTRSKSIN